MKKWSIWIIFVVLIAGFSGIALAAGEDERNSIIESRKAMIRKISGKTSNEDVVIMLKVLEYGMYLAEPTSGGNLAVNLLESPSDKSIFAVVPLIEGDQNISSSWRNFWNSGVVASINGDAEMPMVIFNNNVKMTELWKTLVFIHEGLREIIFFSGTVGNITDPAQSRAIYEAMAYIYEFKLLDSLGGPDYKALLAQEAKKSKEMYLKNKKLMAVNYRDAYKLDAIFGKPLSVMESEVRWLTFWIHSVFQALDEIQGPRKTDDIKAEFLKDMYAREAY